MFTKRNWVFIAGVLATYFFMNPVVFAAGGGDHIVNIILLELVTIIIAAKIGGHVFEWLNMPAVLGELFAGVFLGNLSLLGFVDLTFMENEQLLLILAEIGVIFLLFEVGLESSVKELTKVGLSSLLVALLGIAAPFILGYACSSLFLPEANGLVHVFIGATLCATSVGITARVLKDIKKTDTKESRIILGAAVIDDVLGLIILALVTGAIHASNAGGGSLHISDIAWLLGKSVLFFVVTILIGIYISPNLFRLASKLRGEGMLLASTLVMCFGLAWFASFIGLAPIVGAFCAGLILDEAHYKEFTMSQEYGGQKIEDRIEPISAFLVPIFFVLMGMKVDLLDFTKIDILGFALTLSLVAIVGKQLCSFGVLSKGTNKWAVGVGMIPRGEVGLIFALQGATLRLNGEPVISSSTYTAVVIMVVITTLITPPVLKILMTKNSTKDINEGKH